MRFHRGFELISSTVPSLLYAERYDSDEVALMGGRSKSTSYPSTWLAPRERKNGPWASPQALGFALHDRGLRHVLVLAACVSTVFLAAHPSVESTKPCVGTRLSPRIVHERALLTQRRCSLALISFTMLILLTAGD